MNSIPEPKGIKIKAISHKTGEELPRISFERVQNIIASQGRDIKMSDDWLFCTPEGLLAQTTQIHQRQELLLRFPTLDHANLLEKILK